MISDLSINSALPIADMLNTRGVVLTEVEHSPFTSVIQHTRTPVLLAADDEATLIDVWKESMKSTIGIGVNVVDTDDGKRVYPAAHEVETNELVKLITHGTNNAMHHARNVAKPKVMTVLASLESKITDKTDLVNQAEIIELPVHEAWNNEIIINLLERVAPARGGVIEAADLPKITAPENLRDILDTGSDSLNRQFDKLISDLDMTPADLFNSIFKSTDRAGGAIGDYIVNRNLVLAKFLMCNILLSTPFENTTLTLDAWEQLFNKLIYAYADTCLMSVEMLEADIAAKRLIFDRNIGTNTIRVIGPVYNKWLEDGGTTEVLLGMWLHSDKGLSENYDSLIEKKASFETIWNNHYTLQAVAAEERRMSNIREAIMIVFRDAINDIPDDELEESHEEITNRLLSIRGAKDHELQDVAQYVTKEFCNIVWPKRPSGYILCDIDRRTKDGLELEQAVMNTTIDYIMDWVTTCFGVVKV